jgi:DNA-binding NarL/FixJ family response regulator
MEASTAPTIAHAELDGLVLGVVVSDDTVLERVTAIANASGVEAQTGSLNGDGLVWESAGEDPTTVLVSLPAAEVQSVVQELRHATPSVSVVVVPAPGEPRASLRRLLDSGADGIVLDSQIETALVGTLIAVEGGQVVIPREMAPRTHAALSFREKQILGLVVMGFTNAGIAAKLFLAESTVKSHLSSAFTKLGVRSRHEAAALLADPEQMGLGVLTIARD